MAERQLPKLHTRVRFPSSAPSINQSIHPLGLFTNWSTIASERQIADWAHVRAPGGHTRAWLVGSDELNPFRRRFVDDEFVIGVCDYCCVEDVFTAHGDVAASEKPWDLRDTQENGIPA